MPWIDKHAVKRIFEAALDPANGVELSYINSRDGIINIHSLVWNQFGSENYTDELRFAWQHTDPSWSYDEMRVRPKPICVLEIQFDFDVSRCQHQEHGSNSTCRQPAFVRCSHCGKVLCLKHFLDRLCFHDVTEERAGPSGTNQNRIAESNDDTDYDDDDFNPSAFRHLRQHTSTTTTSSTTSTTSTTTARPRPYGSPGTYSIDVIEPNWLGPRRLVY